MVRSAFSIQALASYVNKTGRLRHFVDECRASFYNIMYGMDFVGAVAG
jgi:hypothetical protein